MNDSTQPSGTWRSVTRFFGYFGWAGIGMVLLAYILNMNGVLDSSSVIYQALNLVGSIGICCICWLRRTWQPFVLNIVWGSVALRSLLLSLT